MFLSYLFVPFPVYTFSHTNVNVVYKNVRLLKTDPKARWQGYMFYFNEGFCWSAVLLPKNEESKYIKCRFKGKSVNDVQSMSLYNRCDKTSTKFFIGILNSRFMYDYLKTFVNNSAALQINDFRQLPIIVPTEEELHQIEEITEQAIEIKKKLFSKEINEQCANQHLSLLQQQLDTVIRDVYKI